MGEVNIVMGCDKPISFFVVALNIQQFQIKVEEVMIFNSDRYKLIKGLNEVHKDLQISDRHNFPQ